MSDFADEPHQDLHGAWADPSGEFWSVGADFVSNPLAGAARAGTVAHYGSTGVGTTLNP